MAYQQQLDKFLKIVRSALNIDGTGLRSSPIEEVGESLNKFYMQNATAQLSLIPNAADPMTPFAGRPATALAHLPNFVLGLIGSGSRSDMAPYSDFDLMIIVGNNTANQDIIATNDWFRRYLDLSAAQGGHGGTLGKTDEISSDGLNNAGVVWKAVAAANAAGRIGPDFRLLWTHGNADAVLVQFEAALQNRARNASQILPHPFFANSTIQVRAFGVLLQEGLLSTFEGWVRGLVVPSSPNLANATLDVLLTKLPAAYPSDKVDFKQVLPSIVGIPSLMAAANGEIPLLGQASYGSLTLQRLRNPAYGFHPDLAKAWLLLWEIRYDLHLINDIEVNTLTQEHPAVWKKFVEGVWPIFVARLPELQARLKRGDFPRLDQ